MLIESKNIVVRRAGSPSLRFPNFNLKAGEKTILLGPSGSGKTTLLSVLAGLLKPDEGDVLIDGRNLYEIPASKGNRLRGQRFGFVFQTLHLLPSLTLRQNIALAGDLTGKVDGNRLNHLLDILGLSDKADRKPDALSQGEQQRAAIARAVINRPSIIVADEPTSALDDANAMAVMDLLEEQAKETNAALLIATHDNRISDRFQNIINLQHQMKEVA